MAGISKAEREELAAVKAKFETVDLNGNADTAEGIRKAFQKLAVDVHRLVPAGRNKSLAMTHLEDASMRAIRGLAHDAEPAAAHTDAVDQESTTEPVPSTESATEIATPAKARRKPRARVAKEVVEANA